MKCTIAPTLVVLKCGRSSEIVISVMVMTTDMIIAVAIIAIAGDGMSVIEVLHTHTNIEIIPLIPTVRRALIITPVPDLKR